MSFCRFHQAKFLSENDKELIVVHSCAVYSASHYFLG
ncbi:MAG: hypothetical protein ACI97G_000448, partial [Porticoccaceae bacterium]